MRNYDRVSGIGGCMKIFFKFFYCLSGSDHGRHDNYSCQDTQNHSCDNKNFLFHGSFPCIKKAPDNLYFYRLPEAFYA